MTTSTGTGTVSLSNIYIATTSNITSALDEIDIIQCTEDVTGLLNLPTTYPFYKEIVVYNNGITTLDINGIISVNVGDSALIIWPGLENITYSAYYLNNSVTLAPNIVTYQYIATFTLQSGTPYVTSVLVSPDSNMSSFFTGISSTGTSININFPTPAPGGLSNVFIALWSYNTAITAPNLPSFSTALTNMIVNDSNNFQCYRNSPPVVSNPAVPSQSCSQAYYNITSYGAGTGIVYTPVANNTLYTIIGAGYISIVFVS